MTFFTKLASILFCGIHVTLTVSVSNVLYIASLRFRWPVAKWRNKINAIKKKLHAVLGLTITACWRPLKDEKNLSHRLQIAPLVRDRNCCSVFPRNFRSYYCIVFSRLPLKVRCTDSQKETRWNNIEFGVYHAEEMLVAIRPECFEPPGIIHKVRCNIFLVQRAQ